MNLSARIWISCLAITAVFGAGSAVAQHKSGAAAFLEGFANGMRDAEVRRHRQAETALIEQETARLQQEKSALTDATKSAARNAFVARWAKASTKPLSPIGKRQRSSDKPDEWSEDSLALEGAKTLSETIIEVYRVADLSSALAKRLKSGSMVDRLAIDCKKGSITGLEVAFFQLSNGLGDPINHFINFEILTRPFASSFETIYEKSCGRLAEINWAAVVSRFIAQAKLVDGLDYAEEDKRKEFNDLVKAYGALADAKNMSDEDLAASKWALDQAHSEMKTRHLTKR